LPLSGKNERTFSFLPQNSHRRNSPETPSRLARAAGKLHNPVDPKRVAALVKATRA
jgi:hypothetical protein